MHQSELEESTRGSWNKEILEWGLQHLSYSGRPGKAETEQMPTSSPQLCHIAAREASRERVSAALLPPAAVKLARSQDSSVMFSLTRTRLLLRKWVLLLTFPSLPPPWPCFCSAMGPFEVFSRKEWCGLQARGTRTNGEESPSAPGFRRQRLYCSEALDCLGAGWSKGSCG